MSVLEIAVGLSLVLASQAQTEPSGSTLEVQLRSEDPAALAREARRLGDPRRGALVFYQPTLTCTKCHVSETGAPTLGPDLGALGKDVSGRLPRRVDPRSVEGDQERVMRPSRSARRTAAR